jgi:two-component system, NtrC family, nitrogen regulation response regulator GlnG
MTSRATRQLVKQSLIVGDSVEMAGVISQIEDAAESDSPVLIEGEPGTGRELVARTIHYAGPRRSGDFVAVKATNIPKALLEGELFASRSSSLRRANGGTLLLKDVDTLPRGPQRGLARVLKRRDRDRDRDETSGENYDVRVIVAADGDLEQSVAADGFDRELYDRLGTRKIRIPPLRRRLSDLPRLVRYFLHQAGEESGRGKPSITDRALDRLAQYPWPGNVAELKDVARRIVLRPGAGGRRAAGASGQPGAPGAPGPIDCADVEAVLPQVAERIPLEDMALEEIVRAKLKGFLSRVGGYSIENLYDDVIARVERPLLALVMEHAEGNQLHASQILGMNRNTLRKKLAQHGLADTEDRPRRRRR